MALVRGTTSEVFTFRRYHRDNRTTSYGNAVTGRPYMHTAMWTRSTSFCVGDAALFHLVDGVGFDVWHRGGR